MGNGNWDVDAGCWNLKRQRLTICVINDNICGSLTKTQTIHLRVKLRWIHEGVDMGHKNIVGEVRQSSTFDSFVPQNKTQKKVADDLRQLADNIAKHPRILDAGSPFEQGRIIVLWGGPGVGKTHLLEATINHIRVVNPAAVKRMYMSRFPLTHEHISYSNGFDYNGCNVVFLDDVYSEFTDLSRLSDVTDIPSFMKLVTVVYERRLLVVVTSNFNFTDGIVARTAKVDKIGRALSRPRELMANSGELHIVGSDYRAKLAKKIGKRELFTL